MKLQPLAELAEMKNQDGERIFRVLRGCVELGYSVSPKEVIGIVEKGVSSRALNSKQLRAMQHYFYDGVLKQMDNGRKSVAKAYARIGKYLGRHIDGRGNSKTL